MALYTVLKLVQIAFYITVALIAVLTFLKAKNTLLNSVHTEYQKRVMDHLAELSEELYSEYDPESPNYWARQDSVGEVLERIHEKWKPYKNEIIAKKTKGFPGIPVSSLESKLWRLVDKYRSDPFIPSDIREKIVQFFDKRVSMIHEAFCDEIRKYMDELVEGKHWNTLDDNRDWMHNRILDRLTSSGCGIAQIHEEVHRIRNDIQKYLEGYNPIKKSRY